MIFNALYTDKYFFYNVVHNNPIQIYVINKLGLK